jgi:hypothetical protein
MAADHEVAGLVIDIDASIVRVIQRRKRGGDVEEDLRAPRRVMDSSGGERLPLQPRATQLDFGVMTVPIT